MSILSNEWLHDAQWTAAVHEVHAWWLLFTTITTLSAWLDMHVGHGSGTGPGFKATCLGGAPLEHRAGQALHVKVNVRLTRHVRKDLDNCD